MRLVEFLQGGDFICGEAHGNGGESIREMVRLGGPNDRCGDERFAEHPGQRDLRVGQTAMFSDLAQPVDDFAIARFGARVQAVAKLVGLGALGGFALPWTGQAAAGQRTPGNDPDACLPSQLKPRTGCGS